MVESAMHKVYRPLFAAKLALHISHTALDACDRLLKSYDPSVVINDPHKFEYAQFLDEPSNDLSMLLPRDGTPIKLHRGHWGIWWM